MPKFKVGDKVRVNRKTFMNGWSESKIPIGTIGELAERFLSSDGCTPYWRLKNYPISCYDYVFESDIELAENYYFNMVDTINNAYQKMDLDFLSTMDMGNVIYRTDYIGEYANYPFFIKDYSNSNCEKSPKNIMTTIKEFAKNLVLSADEKLLRKHGLKDGCGSYTADAKDLVIEKLTSDNEKYLIDIAEQKEKEENKK